MNRIVLALCPRLQCGVVQFFIFGRREAVGIRRGSTYSDDVGELRTSQALIID